MKLGFKQIEPFLKKPDPHVRAVLVYGPDQGLVRERARLLGRHQVEDLQDPFGVCVLEAAELSENPARLMEETYAVPMFGGGKLVWIRGAGDKTAGAFRDYLDKPCDEALVIAEAENLTPRSSLRGLFEKAENAAALPCYVEDGAQLQRTIGEILRDSGYEAERDAVLYLAQNLGGDRAVVRGALETLITYMGGPVTGAARQKITLDAAMQSVGFAGETMLDSVTEALTAGRIADLQAGLAQLYEQGIPPIAVLRAVQNHLRRLHAAKAMIAEGRTEKEAMAGLNPPVFFKQEKSFVQSLQKWPVPKVIRALGYVKNLEEDIKRSGRPPETLVAYGLGRLAHFA